MTKHDTLLDNRDATVHGYLFPAFPRQEFGAIEGRISDINIHHDEPSVVLIEHLSQQKIRFLISDESCTELEKHLTAKNAWKHRQVCVEGIINYDKDGEIVQVIDGQLPVQNGRIVFIEPGEVSLKYLHDPDFKGGLPVAKYFDKLRENELACTDSAVSLHLS